MLAVNVIAQPQKPNYNHPEGPLCPLNGITPGSFGKGCTLLCLYSSSGVCEDPVAWLLELEEFKRRGSLEDAPWQAVFTLSSVVDGVSVAGAGFDGTVSTESCCDCVFSWRCMNWTISGTRVGTLDARFSTCDTWKIIINAIIWLLKYTIL